MTRRYLALYWVLHVITGKPVVIYRDHTGEEFLRLVRRRLVRGAWRNVIFRYSSARPIELVDGGRCIEWLYPGTWKPIYGTFTPRLAEHAGLGD